MPRLKPLPRAEAAPEAVAVYDKVFGPDRDPAVSPGTSTGTPGDFFTTWAHAPRILAHFQSYAPDPPLDPQLRALALARTGYAVGSKFVFSQNCKTCRLAGVPEAKIAAVPAWTTSDVFTTQERAVLAFVDANILEGGRVRDEVIATLKETFSDPLLLTLAFTINLFAMHARSARALRLDYDDAPERLTEIPAPDTPRVQDWL